MQKEATDKDFGQTLQELILYSSIFSHTPLDTAAFYGIETTIKLKLTCLLSYEKNTHFYLYQFNFSVFTGLCEKISMLISYNQ